MTLEPTTNASLLVRLRDRQDSTAWTQFVDVYGPLIYRYAHRHGLQAADAADLTQDVLCAVAQAMGRFQYDRARGSFRGWLFTATRRALHHFHAGRRRLPEAGNPAFDQLFEDQPAREDQEGWQEWDHEFDRRLLDWAADQVRGEFQAQTWEAFWKTAVEQISPGTVAAALGMSVGAVYVAKSRVLARLRYAIEEIQRE
jgi:RNA polymerase sigma-70 factor (ECF subfamily)